jgi:hypothetical protein
MDKWYVISKSNTDMSANYPISVIHNNLGSEFLSYRQAYSKDFTGTNLILQCVWKKNQYDEWKNLFPIVAKAKNFWLEFDADNHLDKLYGLDQPKDISRFFYKIFEPCSKFIWEQPLWYNPFVREVERIPLRFYTTRFQKPVPVKKDIDFYTCMDTNKNVLETLELFTRFHKDGYKVCLMILNKDLFNFYKDKLDFPVITNERKFNKSSVKRYEDLMTRSRVYVDLTYRLTTGRVVYDALYRGTYFVGTKTYGGTDHLFPEYSMLTYPVDLRYAYETSLQALDDWTRSNVEAKRAEAIQNAGIRGFIKELREMSK